jgi:hypothetical protein
MMLTAVVDAAYDVAPELWRRYLEIVIQGLRATPGPPDHTSTPPVRAKQVPQVLAALKLRRR